MRNFSAVVRAATSCTNTRVARSLPSIASAHWCEILISWARAARELIPTTAKPAKHADTKMRTLPSCSIRRRSRRKSCPGVGLVSVLRRSPSFEAPAMATNGRRSDAAARAGTCAGVDSLTVAFSARRCTGSERTGRLLQEFQFLRGRGSPQNGVAVRETAKSVDDRAVDFGPLGELGVIEARHQFDAASLRSTILCMFEGEIEEHALLFYQPPIKTACNG